MLAVRVLQIVSSKLRKFPSIPILLRGLFELCSKIFIYKGKVDFMLKRKFAKIVFVLFCIVTLVMPYTTNVLAAKVTSDD